MDSPNKLHEFATGYLFEEFMILIRRIYDGGEGLPLREGGHALPMAPPESTILARSHRLLPIMPSHLEGLLGPLIKWAAGNPRPRSQACIAAEIPTVRACGWRLLVVWDGPHIPR